jgi:hypothetical protein
MKRLGALIFAMALLAAAAPAAGKTRSLRSFVLEGSKSASVVFEIDEKISIVCCEMDQRGSQFGVRGFSAQTEGSYAGFILERVRDRRVLLMAVRLPSMDLFDGDIETSLYWGRPAVLRPGKYKLHLVTDGPSTVTIGFEGSEADRYLEPKGPTKVQASMVDLLDGGLPVGEKRVPIEVDDDSLVGLISHEEGELAQAHYQSQCLTSRGDHCGELDDHGVYPSPASGGGGGTISEVFPSGKVSPGAYDALFAGGNVAVESEAHGFAIVFR